MATSYFEANDIKTALAGLGSSTEPFDHWFRELTREIHGIDLAGTPSA